MAKTDDELHTLAALAEAATRGPWVNGYENGGGSQSVYADRVEIASAYFGPGVERPEQPVANAMFIAAAAPDVVLELVDRVLEAEAIVHALATVDMGDLAPIREGLNTLRELQRRAAEVHLHASPSPASDPELRRWAVNHIKTRFAAWRSPPVETPADSVIDEVVGEILRRASQR